MRLFLLPISTRHTLLYCERTQAKATVEAVAKQSYVDRITNKANETWAKWENSEPKPFLKGGWQKTVTVQGNKILRRIPYQEWGLKTVPSLNDKRKEVLLAGKEKVEILFPGKYLADSKIESVLQKLATERQALHKKRLTWCIIGMPIVSPFALVPIIPNIPFFYLAFRAYSHWKALAGSKHIQFLLEKTLFSKTPSSDLDQVYTAGLMYPTRQISRDSPYPTAEQITSVSELVQKQTNNDAEDVMVLQKWNGKLIAERFKLPEMEVEIERAVEQVEKDIKSQQELKQEKQEIEVATGNRAKVEEIAREHQKDKK
ncbi:hypothetical protein EJ05DRAFT_507778 [Pseudovirgaria hyperparasitica]|uniref:Mitochondrial K+-H+ exchange-related-domain-containing protein n=1 Tax=Pseudovirgaria hyperparasitica TaxID=470096 RepID=A0A6A6WJ76_9PEZI|nr:uncharacterized protein EJ05DRAFT_507778 [Pseudovirgaria hyperparasitica]KAF2762206.1 hypothetical protein EJ05DRAFT_507778 [Pseudovirgaria hyperparasitica]